METCSLILAVGSGDKILWCDQSDETFSEALLCGTCTINLLYKMIFGIFFLEVCVLAVT